MNVRHKLIKPLETNNHIPPHYEDSSCAVRHVNRKPLEVDLFEGK